MAENGNKRWTPEEDSRLRELIRSPAAAFDIAAELGRTVSAVKGRAQLLRLPVSRDDYLHRPAIQRLLSFFGASTGFWVCRMPLSQEPGLFTLASATSFHRQIFPDETLSFGFSSPTTRNGKRLSQLGHDFRRRNRMREKPGFSNKRSDLLQRKSYHGSLG